MKFPAPKVPPTSHAIAPIDLGAVLAIIEANRVNVTGPESEDPSALMDEALLALIDGKRTVAEILGLSRMSGSVAMRRLRSLAERRLVRAVRRDTNVAWPRAATLDGRTQNLSATAHAFAVGVPPAPVSPIPPAAAAKPTEETGLSARAPIPTAAPSPAPSVTTSRPSPRTEVRQTVSAPRPTPARDPRHPAVFVMPTGAPADEPAVEPPTPIVSSTRELAPVLPSETGLVAYESGGLTTTGRPSFAGPIDDFVRASEAQDLWLSLARQDWSTLVLIPADPRSSALPIASALVKACHAFTGKRMDLLCAEGQDLDPLEHWIFERSPQMKPGPARQGGQLPAEGRFDRVIVLDPLALNPVGATVAKAADAVLLVIEAGTSRIAAARRAVESIGRERFVGCVMVSSR